MVCQGEKVKTPLLAGIAIGIPRISLAVRQFAVRMKIAEVGVVLYVWHRRLHLELLPGTVHLGGFGHLFQHFNDLRTGYGSQVSCHFSHPLIGPKVGNIDPIQENPALCPGGGQYLPTQSNGQCGAASHPYVLMKCAQQEKLQRGGGPSLRQLIDDDHVFVPRNGLRITRRIDEIDHFLHSLLNGSRIWRS